MEFDLVIRGGTLVDGSGAPGRAGDLAVRAGRIAALGSVPGRGAREIAAEGCVVAPGFIDLHTHYDAQILWDRMLSISPWHGVTTVVMGNCGFGVAPVRPEHRGLILRTLEKVEGMSLAALEAGLGADWAFESFPQYLDAIEARGSAINVAALLGHTPLRLYVMGEESTARAALPEEVARMRALVGEAMAAGAIGFATSKSPTHVGYAGRPVPSRLAEWEETRSLAHALADAGRGVLQVTPGPGLFFDELGTLAGETGRRITWTALLAGMLGPDGHRVALAKAREQQRAGQAVIPQVSCRPLDFDFDLVEPFPLESLPAMAPVSAADRAGKLRHYADPQFRARIAEQMESPRSLLRGIWHRTWISRYPPDPALEERRLAEVAAERGVAPVDLFFALAASSALDVRYRMSIFNYDEAAVSELLRSEGTVLGLSDAGAHASQLCDACFSTHLLGHWVRELGALPLERAVWMLTARPAQVMGIADRGRLAPGLAADVTVFDPTRVGAGRLRRVHDLPAGGDRLVADAHGVEAVIVNGRLLRSEGRDVVDPEGPLPGQLLRDAGR